MAGKSWRRTTTWLVRGLLLAVLAMVGFALAVLVVIPRATHGTAMTVLTGSMTPKIPVGSVVVDRPVDPSTLHVGDIATYQKEPGKAEYVTHRIVQINTKTTPTTFVFKGDANRGPDITPVPATSIRGKVWFHVAYLGSIRDAITSKGGLAGVGMLLLACYAIYQLVGGLRERKAPVEPTETDPPSVAAERSTAEDIRDRSLILATLPVAAFEGLRPPAVARLLSAVLLDVEAGAATFTVLLSDSPERTPQTVQLLSAFAPTRLEVSTGAERTACLPLTRWEPLALPAGELSAAGSPDE